MPPASCERAASPEGTRISFRISILTSGSTGNCTLLETEHTTLLIDAGLGKKELLRRLEALGRAQPDRVDGILVTHEHSDHSSGIAQLARLFNCPAYLTEPTHCEILKMYPEGPVQKMERVEHIHAGERFEIGDIEINPFAIPHDAADPVAFSFRTQGLKMSVVTDLGYMPDSIKVPAAGDTTFVTITLAVSDSEGLGDIVSVKLTSKKPDGSSSGQFNLYDDGGTIFNTQFGVPMSSGDLTAGDGIYTIRIPFTGTPEPPPTYRDFSFVATDRTGDHSNTLTLRIYIVQ